MAELTPIRSSATETALVDSALGKFRTFGHGASITPEESAAMAARIVRLQEMLEAPGTKAVQLAGVIS